MKPQNTDEINDLLSFGDSPDVEEFTIDEARYPSAAKAMREILDGYIAEGKTTKDFIMNVAGVFGPGIRPYLHRFINEWQEEQKTKKIETKVLKAIRMAEEPEAVRL